MMTGAIVNPAPGIIWVVEARGVLVVDSANSCQHFLSYPGAAVWSVVIRHGINPESFALVGAICKINKGDTALLVERSLADWKDKGLIVIA